MVGSVQTNFVHKDTNCVSFRVGRVKVADHLFRRDIIPGREIVGEIESLVIAKRRSIDGIV